VRVPARLIRSQNGDPEESDKDDPRGDLECKASSKDVLA
jgi:hypothetical protein